MVIIWDRSDDTFTEWVVAAADDSEAKAKALDNRLRSNGDDPNETEYDERGGKNGYQPVLVYDHAFLDQIFPKRRKKPKPRMTTEEMVKQGIIVPAGTAKYRQLSGT